MNPLGIHISVQIWIYLPTYQRLSSLQLRNTENIAILKGYCQYLTLGTINISALTIIYNVVLNFIGAKSNIQLWYLSLSLSLLSLSSLSHLSLSSLSLSLILIILIYNNNINYYTILLIYVIILIYICYNIYNIHIRYIYTIVYII